MDASKINIEEMPVTMSNRLLNFCWVMVHHWPIVTILCISFFQGFCLTLLSELRSDQHSLVKSHIQKCLGLSDHMITANISNPSRETPTAPHRRKVGSFWLACSPRTTSAEPEDYILTRSVAKNLENLARAISAR